MTPSRSFEGYTDLALQGVQRVLSRLDRRPWSPTFGCFDREYWHYKTLLEFPRADFQQAMWPLALVQGWKDPANPYQSQPAITSWVTAALRFWSTMRYADGTVSEWYLHERSYCATAFTSAAAGQSLLLMKNAPAAPLLHPIDAVERSTHWLARHTGECLGAANQVMAALLAAHSAARLTGRACCQQAYKDLKTAALAMQQPEGWFNEHTGADIGYSFLIADLLALLHAQTEDRDYQSSAFRLLDFLDPFVHPAGVFGGDLNHRATNHYFPHGVEYFARGGHTTARRIAAKARTLIATARVPTPLSADDTYLSYFYLASYALAATAGPLTGIDDEKGSPPASNPVAFPSAGLHVYQGTHYRAVVNTRKGVWQAFDDKGKMYGDAGYIARINDNRLLTSALDTADSRVDVSEGGPLNIELRKSFGVLNTTLPLKRWILEFKFLTRWVLSIPSIARWAGRCIRQKNIWKIRKEALSVERTWSFFPDRIEIKDRLVSGQRSAIKALYRAKEGAGVHNPSSQLFTASSLESADGEDLPLKPDSSEPSAEYPQRFTFQ